MTKANRQPHLFGYSLRLRPLTEGDFELYLLLQRMNMGVLSAAAQTDLEFRLRRGVQSLERISHHDP